MAEHDNTVTASGIKRRTVAKGMAWTVPVVSVAAAAPAYAASPECTITFGGDSCKCPGQSQGGNEFGYYLQFCYTCEGGGEPPAGDVTITAVAKANGSQFTPAAGCGFPGISLPYTFDPTAGCTPTFRFLGTNSGNFINVTFRVGDGPEETVRLASPPDCSGPLATQRCEACATPQ
jgi:hypothetical protein